MAGYDYASCIDGEATGASCTPTCLATHNNGGTAVTTPFVLSCDGAGAFDGSPDVVTGLTCSENTCNAAGGTRTGYACSGATTATACDDGTASTATTVTEFGSVTCATGYGTGPLALLAGNGPAVTCTNGGDFAFTGCHNRKCDAIDDASNDFSETNCMPNPGTKIMDPLTDIFCETTTCASTDCCTVREHMGPRTSTGAGQGR